MRHLQEMIEKIFKMRLYDGEQGAAGGAASPASEGGAGGDPGAGTAVEELDVPIPDFDDPTIPESARKAFVENDPEYQEILRADKKKKDSKAKADDKKGGTDDDLLDDDSEKNAGPDDKGKPAPKDKPVDDKNSDEGSDDEPLDFADDVIEGLKGEHVKALPPEAQLAIAKFHEKATEDSAERVKAESAYEKLISDPVIKARKEMIEAGKTKYDDYGFTATEKKNLVSAIMEKVDLDENEAGIVVSQLETAIENVVNHRADARFHNRLVQEDGNRRIQENTTKGRQAFLSLGEFNKELVFKEKDANAFWTEGVDDKGNKIQVLNNKHPEIKKYREKIIPIMAALHEAGVSYEGVTRMIANPKVGAKGLYAFAGTLLDLPVAINTGDRDRKMVLSERKKALGKLLKSDTGELSMEGQSSIAGKPRDKNTVVKEGYDLLKLHEGGDYYDQAMMEKPGDLNHADKITRLAEEGRALANSRSKRKQ
jgi:hypothetical protein